MVWVRVGVWTGIRKTQSNVKHFGIEQISANILPHFNGMSIMNSVVEAV